MFSFRIINCLLLLALVSACADDSRLPARELRGNAMGTSYKVIIVDPAADLPLELLRNALRDRIEQIENTASTYRDSSDISKFNHNPATGWVSVSDELCSMIDAAQSVSRETSGAFDITVGSLVNLWGFGPGFTADELPGDVDIAHALAASGFEKLHTDCDNAVLKKSVPALQLDLSGWAKGYAVDQLAEILDSMGQADYLVEIGGELKVRGQNAKRQPFSIAIERPNPDQDSDLAVLSVTNTAIATSGDYRNYFEYEGIRYSHAINPESGRPVRHTVSAVTVVHSSAAYADAIATALLVMGFDEGMRFAREHSIAALFAVADNNGVEYHSSPAFETGQFLSGKAVP